MSIKMSAQDAVARWKSGVAGAGTRYTQGINNSADWAAAATAPAAVAARNAGLQRAMQSGAIEAGINRVGTGVWRATTVAKAANWQTGVNSPLAQARATAGFTRLFGYLQQAQSAMANTPRGGFNENVARMVAHATSMHDSAQADKSSGRG